MPVYYRYVAPLGLDCFSRAGVITMFMFSPRPLPSNTYANKQTILAEMLLAAAQETMDKYFPFSINFTNGAVHGSPEQMYQIVADFDSPDLASYKALFERYSPAEGLISLVDVVTLIIEGSTPDLADHMDFDEERFILDMYADSEEAVQEFASVVCPAFQDIEELKRYVRKVADE